MLLPIYVFGYSLYIFSFIYVICETLCHYCIYHVNHYDVRHDAHHHDERLHMTFISTHAGSGAACAA